MGIVMSLLLVVAKQPLTNLEWVGLMPCMHYLLRNESPETASRPFDGTRDGFVLGEGAGALSWKNTNMQKLEVQKSMQNLLVVDSLQMPTI